MIQILILYIYKMRYKVYMFYLVAGAWKRLFGNLCMQNAATEVFLTKFQPMYMTLEQIRTSFCTHYTSDIILLIQNLTS